MAQDSYSGKVYLALGIGDLVEGLMKVWVSRVREAVWWSLVREDKETWGSH